MHGTLGVLRGRDSGSRVTSSFGLECGGGGIRTHGSGVSGKGETRSGDYKSPALNHSATPPTKEKRANGPDRGLGHKRDPLNGVSSLLSWKLLPVDGCRFQHLYESKEDAGLQAYSAQLVAGTVLPPTRYGATLWKRWAIHNDIGIQETKATSPVARS